MVEGFTAGGQCPELVSGHPPHGTPAAGDVTRGREGFEFALSGGVQVEGLSGFHGVSFAHVTILQQLEASSGPLVPLCQAERHPRRTIAPRDKKSLSLSSSFLKRSTA